MFQVELKASYANRVAVVSQNQILQSLIAENLVSDPEGARGRLLTEAARLFREKGYERTTVRDLAAAVGIQSGSLFHHFRTKEEILKAVMVETIRLNTALMQAALEAADTSRLELRDIYEKLWLDVLESLKREGALEADPFVVRRMLTGALSWTVTWYKPERGGLTLDGLTDQVMAMMAL